jgi:hypothetical protein
MMFFVGKTDSTAEIFKAWRVDNIGTHKHLISAGHFLKNAGSAANNRKPAKRIMKKLRRAVVDALRSF